MGNKYLRIYLHMVFAVKNRNALISEKDSSRIHSYMTSILERQGHIPLAIGGMPDHVHFLFGYVPNEQIEDIVKTVKANTSKFINENHITPYRFEWQRGYGCFSVSHYRINAVKNYIDNQQEHHKSKTFLQEFENFLSIHKIDYERAYLFSPPL